MATGVVQCYNKSCGVKYDEAENNEKSCQFHPGVPVFHDALKGWSCCKKRTTDFTDFLKIPGCTHGFHSNKKPVEELKPKVKTKKEIVELPPAQPRVYPPPKRIVEDKTERPSADEPMQKLAVSVTSSYNKAKVNQTRVSEDDGTVKIGTKCRNGGCEAAYANGPTDEEACLHHPGTAVFHEGMKYWSCCKRKTSDFTSFLNQAGCTKGNHLWRKPVEAKVTCRHDWHQTGPNVIISIFAKNCNIETSTFEANQVYLKASLDFEDKKHFELNLNLCGVVEPARSKVTVSATKVELTLRKGRAETWKKLGEIQEEEEEEKEEEVAEEIKDDEESEASDLDGIDDVIFD